MRRSRGSSRGRVIPRTQNNSPVYRKTRRGAPAGNENAKKVLKWLPGYDLSTPEGVDAFLQEVIKRTWTGELGTRAAGALNGSLRVLLEHLALPALEKRIEQLEARGVRS